MTNTPDPSATASWTNAEKSAMAGDFQTFASIVFEHGQYLFNCIAAINVQQEILISKNIISEDELKGRIENELKRMKAEFEKTQRPAEASNTPEA